MVRVLQVEGITPNKLTSQSRFGRKTTGTVLEIRQSPVASTSEIAHIVLQDGRQIYDSLAHPTADGRTFGELNVGGILDNSVITVAELVPYNQGYTYDLLPGGDTGLLLGQQHFGR